MTRPVKDREVDRLLGRACINQNRAALARALRMARARGCGRQARAWACWVGWPSLLGSDRRPEGECPTCGETAYLKVPVDGGMDDDGPRCAPCWRSAWDHGRAHVPEAWLLGGEWPYQGEDGAWYAPDAPEHESGPSWPTYRGALDALWLPDPALRPARLSEIPAVTS